MTVILLHLITSCGYIFGTWKIWHKSRHRKNTPIAAFPKYFRLGLGVPVILHLYLVITAIYRLDGVYFGLGTSISTIFVLATLIYWFSSFLFRLDALYILIFPAAAVTSLLPLIVPVNMPLTPNLTPYFTTHLTMSMLAYSLLTIACFHVLLMAFIQKNLHSGKINNIAFELPSVLTMEIILYRIILAGFLLLSLSLATGMYFAEQTTGAAISLSHKTIFGILSWMIFGILLLGRVFLGWRGRTAIRWTLAGFASLLLAYIGSSFVVEILLNG